MKKLLLYFCFFWMVFVPVSVQTTFRFRYDAIKADAPGNVISAMGFKINTATLHS